VSAFLDALRNAPLSVVSKRWPRVIHAVTEVELQYRWPGETVTAVCGRRRLRVLVDGDGPLLFPPSTAELPRCQQCFVALGRPRPRRRRSLTGRRV
jgi:hypothetical protein